MARLVKRKTVEAPKPLPARGEEEVPETSLCKGVETDVKPKDKEPLLGWCEDCKTHAAYSNVDHLCYVCHKLRQGLVYDTGDKCWVKIKEKK